MKTTILKYAIVASALASVGFAGDNSVCQFNLFVLGNATAQYSDVQGRVAVGGNATYTGYDFASQVSGLNSRFNLLVGGDLKFSNGQIEHGSVVSNGSVTFTNVTVVNGNITAGGAINLTNGQVNGTVNPNIYQQIPFTFGAAMGFLQNASYYYGTLPATGTTTNQYGGLFLNGTDPALNVFSVSASLLKSVWGVQINVPAGSTVLINVSGTSATMPNVGYNYTGTDANHVIFNFYQASTLTVGAGQGSILAPLANIKFQSGAVNGTVIGNAFTGNGQINQAPFVDGLPVLPSGYSFCSDIPSYSLPQ